MPRIPRGQAAGYVYHIINRGNGRSEIFHKSQDYQAFLDEHLLTVLRYVLQNPVRAGLAKSPSEWTWSSISQKEMSDPLPLEVPADWLEGVERPLRDSEIEALRDCVNRQRPFGVLDWGAIGVRLSILDNLPFSVILRRAWLVVREFIPPVFSTTSLFEATKGEKRFATTEITRPI